MCTPGCPRMQLSHRSPLPAGFLPFLESFSIIASLLTQELNSKVAGFCEQTPSNDDLLSGVECIPHDQGDAWGDKSS